ncbi:MAG: zinc-ribbon domain-containing protein [Pyrinomonadaceae bacterium]|nr:zinc-ribbon domain-containing protein [Pyrinomonadaceae bacterium]
MSLINCPECGHEVSNAASACPNCGHPLSAPPHVKNRVVTQPVVTQRDEFPKWIIIPIGVLGLIFIFVVFALMRNNDPESNINVNLAKQRTSGADEVRVPERDRTVVQTVPDQTVTQSIPPDTQTTVIEPDTPSSGTIKIEAKILDEDGEEKTVKREKFYLLEKDLETVLREANIKSIDGQSLVNSFGLAILNPSKYPEIRTKSLKAIEENMKFDAITDSSGMATLSGVKPGSYYLFGITKTGDGFAIWNSPVFVNSGQNSFVLPPATMNKISNRSE